MWERGAGVCEVLKRSAVATFLIQTRCALQREGGEREMAIARAVECESTQAFSVLLSGGKRFSEGL